MSVQYVGPFIGRCDLVVDGWKVPLVDARELDGGVISFVLDQRMGYTFPVGVADDVARFVADAIAVAMGLGAHPREEYDDAEMREFQKHSGTHPVLLPRRVHEIVGSREEERPPDV